MPRRHLHRAHGRRLPRHAGRQRRLRAAASELRVAEAFPNGEGGVCAPVAGRITLGAGTPDRIVLAVAGDSCQDGAGDPTTSSFTGLGRFTVAYGTGA